MSDRPLTRPDGSIDAVELEHRLDELKYTIALNARKAESDHKDLASAMALGFKDMKASIDILSGEKKVQNGRLDKVEVALKKLEDWKDKLANWFEHQDGESDGRHSVYGWIDRGIVLVIAGASVGIAFIALVLK